jgi:hypothetical protein
MSGLFFSTSYGGKLGYSTQEHSWVATIAIGNLNLGDINVGLGYDYRKLVSTGDTDNDIRAFLEWSVDY